MRTIDTRELEELRRSGDPLVVNVLDPEQHRKVHIPDTENVPVGEESFVERVERRAGDRERTVVVYCAGPDCDASPRAARKLDAAGFADVRDYEGGIEEWRAAGNELERAEEATV